MMHKEFNTLVTRNLRTWKRLTRWLATERLAKRLRGGQLTLGKLKHDIMAAH